LKNSDTTHQKYDFDQIQPKLTGLKEDRDQFNNQLLTNKSEMSNYNNLTYTLSNYDEKLEKIESNKSDIEMNIVKAQ